jgi:hypothetical protein
MSEQEDENNGFETEGETGGTERPDEEPGVAPDRQEGFPIEPET